MTGYFDDASRQIMLTAGFADAAFLAVVEAVEERVIHAVSLCTGDREFPDDLRERALTAIACLRVKTTISGCPTDGRRYCATMRTSTLIERLHSLFHELAGRRLVMRFGLVQDSPEGFLRRRAAWEKEQYAETEV